MTFSATQIMKVQDLTQISLQPRPVLIDVVVYTRKK
jgi:hypothetical protein